MPYRISIYRDDQSLLDDIIGSNSPKRVFEIVSDDKYEPALNDDVSQAVEDLVKHGLPEQADKPAAWARALWTLVDKHAVHCGDLKGDSRAEMPNVEALTHTSDSSSWNLSGLQNDSLHVAHKTALETDELLATLKSSAPEDDAALDAHQTVVGYLEQASAAGTGAMIFVAEW